MDKKSIVSRYRFFPMLVSATGDKIDEQNQKISRWERFDGMPEAIKDHLTSGSVSEDIEKIEKGFHLQPQETEEVSRIIRDVLFRLIKEEDVPKEIARRIKSVGPQHVQSLATILKNRFFSVAKSAPAKGQGTQSVKVTIAEALERFPMVAGQILSRAPLVIAAGKEPVRPTVENWVTLYQREVGPGNKDAMKRGNFLFLNPNTKKLTPQERQRVAAVLKSLDEGALLDLDSAKQEILLPHGLPSVHSHSAVPRPGIGHGSVPMAGQRAQTVSAKPNAPGVPKNDKRPTPDVPQSQSTDRRMGSGTVAGNHPGKPGEVRFSAGHMFPVETAKPPARNDSPYAMPDPAKRESPSRSGQPAKVVNLKSLKP